MFEAIKRSEIKVTEAAKLLNVSRVSVSCWVNNRKKPHKFIKRRVEEFIDAVESAERNGKLPISKDTPRENRIQVLISVLDNHGWTSDYDLAS